MRCYRHEEIEAVGVCLQCGKAGCRDCLEDIFGSLICKTCMAVRLRESAKLGVSQLQPTGVLKRDEVEAAKSRVRWSWIVAVSFAVIMFFVYLGIIMTIPDFNAPVIAYVLLSALGSLMFGYVVWSAYWGIPTIWKWLLELAKNIRGQVSIDYLTLFALYIFFFWFPIVIGIPYGLLGGGVYQYLKQRKVAGQYGIESSNTV